MRFYKISSIFIFIFIFSSQVANIVSSSIQPLQNLIVEVIIKSDSTICNMFGFLVELIIMPFNLQKYLEEKCGTEEKLSWIHMIIGKGFLGKFSLAFST